MTPQEQARLDAAYPGTIAGRREALHRDVDRLLADLRKHWAGRLLLRAASVYARWTRPEPCPGCDGRGGEYAAPYGWVLCGDCEGAGQ